MPYKSEVSLDTIDRIDALIDTALGVGKILNCMSSGIPEMERSEREALNVLADALYQSVFDLRESGWYCGDD